MDVHRIKELLDVAADCTAAEIEFEENGMKIVVRRNSPPVVVQPQVMLPPYGAVAPPIPVTHPPQPITTPAPAPAPKADADEEKGIIVYAPTPGTYYSAQSPGADPFVSVGDQVEIGDTLCIIEAMKLMNEIECEHAGRVVRIYLDDAEPVEYDQPLFLIDPD